MFSLDRASGIRIDSKLRYQCGRRAVQQKIVEARKDNLHSILAQHDTLLMLWSAANARLHWQFDKAGKIICAQQRMSPSLPKRAVHNWQVEVQWRSTSHYQSTS